MCLPLIQFSCDDRENVYFILFIIIIKSEVCIHGHCLGLYHETMVRDVSFTMFFCVLPINGEKVEPEPSKSWGAKQNKTNIPVNSLGIFQTSLVHAGIKVNTCKRKMIHMAVGLRIWHSGESFLFTYILTTSWIYNNLILDAALTLYKQKLACSYQQYIGYPL